jgi:hypothetical protein
MKRLLIVIAVLATLFLCSAKTDNSRVWFQFEGCSGDAEGSQGCFFFMEDKETHTRCYAFRALYHEGTALSCVKQ